MDHLPNELLSSIFQYLERHDLIEASAVCIKWYSIIWTDIFCSKINKTNNLFYDKDWLLKTYYKHFQRFRESVYCECIGFLPGEKISVIDTEILVECFIQYFLFVYGHIFGFVLGLNRTLKHVNFVQSYKLETLRLLTILIKSLYLILEGCFLYVLIQRQFIFLKFLFLFMWDLVEANRDQTLKEILVCYSMKR